VDIHVAISALGGRVGIAIYDVAFRAVQINMRALKGKLRLATMVKLVQWGPVGRRMAFITRLRELPLMKVLMTVPAGGLYRFVVPLCMTASARDLLMLTFKFKLANLVIEERNLPGLKTCMTFVTGIRLELTLVNAGMAESAICIRIIFGLSP